jgi:hypothetical protein
MLVCKRWRSPGIDSTSLCSLGAGATILHRLDEPIPWNRFLGSFNVYKFGPWIYALFNVNGHGNAADLLGFLHKPVRHRSLTLRFEPFRFWLRIRGDIRNRKTTPRLTESGESTSLRLAETGSRRLSDSPSLLLKIQKLTLRLGESFFDYEYLRESEAKIGTARKIV